MQHPQVQFQTQPAAGFPSQHQPRPLFAQNMQKACGILQITLGVYAFFLGIASIILKAGQVYVVGTGIWSSFFMIIAGSLGVVSARNERTGHIVACMVMSIFSSLAGTCFLGFSAAACGIDTSFKNSVYRNFNGPGDTDGALAVDSLGILVSLTEIINALVQSGVCCRTTCCAPRQAIRAVYLQPGAQPNAGNQGGQATAQMVSLTPVAMQPTGVGGAMHPQHQLVIGLHVQQQPVMGLHPQQQPVIGATGISQPNAGATPAFQAPPYQEKP